MIPLWKIQTGQFAGWHSDDAVYDAKGQHVGYLAGHLAYSLNGVVLGEIYQAEWIGQRQAAAYLSGERHAPRESVAHERLPDRRGLQLDGWQDPVM